MNVFISWSGDLSHQVALALRDWLPQVVHSIEPFVSSQDVYAGSRWQAEIAAQLEASQFGIVCVTSENQTSGWLNFEAGAIVKAVAVGRVVPLAVDLSPAEVEQPLGQFQAKRLDEAGIHDTVQSINASSPAPLPEDRIQRSVSKWWPDLADDLERRRSSLSAGTGPAVERSDRELLEEVLNVVRGLARSEQAVHSLDFGSAGWRPRRNAAAAIHAIHAVLGVVAKEDPKVELRTFEDGMYVNTAQPITPATKQVAWDAAAKDGLSVYFLADAPADSSLHDVYVRSKTIFKFA